MSKVLILGAGLVARPLVHYLLDNGYEVVTMFFLYSMQYRATVG